jgi:Ribonuclease G/E
METCTTCRGIGHISSIQTDSYTVLRSLQESLSEVKQQKEVTVSVNPALFEYLSSSEYNALLDLEKEHRVKITLQTDIALSPTQYKISKV